MGKGKRLKRWLTVCATGLALSVQPIHARAEPLDMAAIDCRELLAMPLARLVLVGSWMSGYFHAEMGSTTIDPDEMDNFGAVLGQYCDENPDSTVMDAIQQLFMDDD